MTYTQNLVEIVIRKDSTSLQNICEDEEVVTVTPHTILVEVGENYFMNLEELVGDYHRFKEGYAECIDGEP